VTHQLATNARHMNVATTLRQIGGMNVLAISGGRRSVDSTGALVLPVSNGYTVRITLAANDTYTVERLWKRSGQTKVKGEWNMVYASELGETCYQASVNK
jgi:hypothetical protein